MISDKFPPCKAFAKHGTRSANPTDTVEILPDYRETWQGLIVYAERVGFDDVRTGPRAYFLSAWTRDEKLGTNAVRYIGKQKVFKLRDKTAAMAALIDAFPEFAQEQLMIIEARKLNIISPPQKFHIDI